MNYITTIAHNQDCVKKISASLVGTTISEIDDEFERQTAYRVMYKTRRKGYHSAYE